jgi:peptide/nickel transport system permease protein
VGGFAYVIRSLAVSTMGEDFVTTARARGMTENRVLFRHVLQDGLAEHRDPVDPRGGGLLRGGDHHGGGLQVARPIGYLTFAAITRERPPGHCWFTTFVLTVILFLGLYLGELTYGLLDPRIKTGD